MMKPLDGLKVLDFSTLLPGPFASMLLADMGADVIRVEPPDKPDLVRDLEPQIEGQSSAFRYLNRGKRSIALNLKSQKAIEVVHKLLDEFDIVIEQFRPGVMTKLGIGYEQLKQVKPDLIYCSITGYGQDGEYATRAGHDINYLALSGISSHTGRVSSGPSLSGLQIADLAGGSQPAVIGILSAVIHRSRTGEGAHIDISMADNCLALQPLLVPGQLNGASKEQLETHFLNGAGIYDYYPTRDGRYIAVGSLEPKFKRILLATLNLSDAENLNDESLKVKLKERFLSADQHDWVHLFSAVDACVEPVLDIKQTVNHPLFSSRGLVTTTDTGEIQIAPAIRFNGTVNKLPDPAPNLGGNRDEILSQIGLSQLDIDQLSEQGLFGNQEQ